MQQSYASKEIVWAKVKGYPWWPAKIVKLPSPQAQVFKVEFIAEDTHAFLNPKDVRKYEEYYDEYSKKKMRGLAPAIQTADEMHKKRVDSLLKAPSHPSPTPQEKRIKIKTSPKKKTIKRLFRKRPSESQPSSDEESEESSPEVEKHIKEPVLRKEESELVSEENDEEERFLNESEQRVDRSKVEAFEERLLKIAEKIREDNYQFNRADFEDLDSLSGEELLAGKVTNILAFIVRQESMEREELAWLEGVRKTLKDRVVEHLYDSTYYDQYIRLIQKNKKSRNEYEGKLSGHLRSQHHLKKELSAIFASRLVAQINNGTISRYKELLEDIKERKIDLSNVNNKAAIDRSIQTLIPKYI